MRLTLNIVSNVEQTAADDTHALHDLSVRWAAALYAIKKYRELNQRMMLEYP